MYDINFLSLVLLDFLEKNMFKASTLKKYKKEIKRLSKFLASHGTTIYSISLGNIYADDYFIDGHFSAQRYYDRGRLIRLLNFYYLNSYFSLKIKGRVKFDSKNILYKNEYQLFKVYILNKDIKSKTKDYYLHQVFHFLSYLSDKKIILEMLSMNDIYEYLNQVDSKTKRHYVCGVREYLRFKNNNRLLVYLSNLHSPREKKIIDILTNKEKERLAQILSGDNINNRDKSIFLLAYLYGIRACDIIALTMNDIDWDNEIISFIQSKTGNRVTLPLLATVGNVILKYLTEERENSKSSCIFVSHYPPYEPLTDHSACYFIVSKILDMANIGRDKGGHGVHFLRHNAASTMVRNKVALETISAVLGHSDPNSTNIYITTDEKELSKCILSFKDIGLEEDFNEEIYE